MKPTESFLGQPIRSLQTMLRLIAQEQRELGTIIPDGIYGPQTQAAVSRFQRSQGLPITGVTNQETWEAVVAAYDAALLGAETAAILEIPLDSVRQSGNRDNAAILLQAMLAALQEAYGCMGTVPPTAKQDAATRDALAQFQKLCGLKATGTAGAATWKHLTGQYPLALFHCGRKSK